MQLEGKVKTMIEFIRWAMNAIENGHKFKQNYSQAFTAIGRYAVLLSEPIELGMFMPCEGGEPVKKPVFQDYVRGKGEDPQYYEDKFNYDKSCEEVLFKGCKLVEGHLANFDNRIIGILQEKPPTVMGWLDGTKTIEDLVKTRVGLEWNDVKL